jgi:serine protease Do
MKQYQHLLPFLALIVVIISPIGCMVPGSTQTLTQPVTQNSIPAAAPTSGGSVVALPSFADLTDAIKHSVVAINTETVVRRRFIQGTVAGAGSGWIYDESGIIVTNNHVIEGAQSVTVQLEDGRTYTPVSIKTDPSNDIAILKINAGKLPALKIGDASKLRVGDWVLVVGNALGMGISVKDGIISRLGVNIQISPSETYSNLIETNAAINPGNSGGPLVNLAGEVIGITSLKLAAGGVEGMGYAINIADALPVIEKLSK